MNDSQATSRSTQTPGTPDGDELAALRGAPVLLLHGFLSTPRALRPLARRLERDGFRVFSVGLGGFAGRFNTRRRIDELARAVRDEVERIYQQNPGMGRLFVIGHSQGGLIASWWVKRLGGHRRVRTLVTLGTPHRGTRMAWAGILLAWLMPSIVQMLPGSRFMRRLRDTAWPARVGLVSIWSRRDRVAPWPSAILEARGANVRNVEVDAGHGDYLLKKRIYGAIVRELRRTEAPRLRPAAVPVAA
ncbi:MAG TPA: alpha/beta fold hydrolase [Anaeromyxobacter sp.]|nr:alpha/beta fold hydrolase [Anaeromyxobacter sp.]